MSQVEFYGKMRENDNESKDWSSLWDTIVVIGILMGSSWKHKGWCSELFVWHLGYEGDVIIGNDNF